MRPEMPVRVVRALIDESGAVVIPAGSELSGAPHLTKPRTWVVRYSVGGLPRSSAVPASVVDVLPASAATRGDGESRLSWTLAVLAMVVLAVLMGAAFMGRG